MFLVARPIITSVVASVITSVIASVISIGFLTLKRGVANPRCIAR
jgi:hypothetical protein